METNIFDGAFDRMIEDEAWQRLSSSYPFSATGTVSAGTAIYAGQ